MVEADDSGSDRRRLIGLIAGGVAAVLIIALLIVGLAASGGSTAIDDALVSGQRPPAPDITLPVLVSGPGLPPAGQRVSLSSLKGTPVVLNLWASWCGPCRDEAPIFETAWERYRTKGALVLGLDLQDLSGNALEFLREYGITYPSLRDGSDASKRDLEATGVPETYIIDKRGRIALHITGQVTELRQITVPLDQVLAEK
ncbi:MAG: TlpA disulfide reductase family protein [Actinobacteria bacterium]|nr:TlpA disulfide reductase family protein [Actinomycetota bacterium]